MKKASLNITLEDNDVFEKEVEELIRAKVREIVRNEATKIVEEETQKEVNRLFNAESWDYRNKLKDMIKEVTREEIKREIGNFGVRGVAERCVDECSKVVMDEITKGIERKCKQVLNDTVNETVKEKLKNILS